MITIDLLKNHPEMIPALANIWHREKVSQPVFALCLNVSPSTVKKWETGEKHPNGAALRLLNIIEKKGLALLLRKLCIRDFPTT